MSEEYRKHYKDVYSLKTGVNTIGRADTCDIVIPSPVSKIVSRFLHLSTNYEFETEFVKTSRIY